MWPMEHRNLTLQLDPHPAASPFAHRGAECPKERFDIAPPDIGTDRPGENGVECRTLFSVHPVMISEFDT
jgi:hypothetical protein